MCSPRTVSALPPLTSNNTKWPAGDASSSMPRDASGSKLDSTRAPTSSRDSIIQGLGMGKAQSNLYLKHVYLSALPLDGVELQYGSLDIWHDESTDLTGYAYNGYVSGERVSIRRPRELFFDDISVAYGYVGDLNSPNAIARLYRLGQSNFHRFMLKKRISERAWISTDYAFQSGTQTWREAIRIRVAELRVLDTFHAEIYEVSHIHPGYGLCCLWGEGYGLKVRCKRGLCGYRSHSV